MPRSQWLQSQIDAIAAEFENWPQWKKAQAELAYQEALKRDRPGCGSGGDERLSSADDDEHECGDR